MMQKNFSLKQMIITLHNEWKNGMGKEDYIFRANRTKCNALFDLLWNISFWQIFTKNVSTKD